MPKFSTDNGVVTVEEALPSIPPEVSRVKILNYAGQEKWRDPKEIAYTVWLRLRPPGTALYVPEVN